MRYKLDNAGYVCAVSFGCYLDTCTEYTGEVPVGYNNLDEWASYACIQAYYISEGNLTLDSERLTECQNKQAQEAIDYAPLVRKDLYESDEVFDSQYIRQTETGKVIVLENIKTIAPRVFITNIEPYEYGKLTILTQGKNMMPCTNKSEKVSGVNFTRNYNRTMSVTGKATANIEYVISECNFTLKANEDYYLNLGGLNCELRFDDEGEIAQQYVGASGLINVPRNIEVSQVVVKISNGQTVNTTFYPQLEHGKSFTSYAEHKCKTLDIDFSSLIKEALFPDDELYPSDELYPRSTTTINYILIENGSVTVSADGIPHLISGGAVGLFGSYSTIYANKDVTLEVTYSSNLIAVDTLEFLQGKSTTTNQFKILKDGSIEAHNGYFSGRIEADSGYFKGEINVNNRFIVDQQGNVTLPSNAVLTWGQIEGTEGVANKSDIPTNTNQLVNGAGFTTMSDVEGKNYTTMSAVEEKGYQNALQVTQITQNTITTELVKGVTGIFSGEIIATSGEIGGMEITSSAIFSGKKTYSDDSTAGVYLGTDGFSIGYSTNTCFKVSRMGDAEIKGHIDIRVGTSTLYSRYESTKATFAYGQSTNAEVSYTGLKVNTLYGNSSLEYNQLKIEATSSDSTLTSNSLSFTDSATIEATGLNDTLKILADNVIIGEMAGKISFFGSTSCSAKKSVTSITTPSSATASTVATKLNELLTALKAYNLIG